MYFTGLVYTWKIRSTQFILGISLIVTLALGLDVRLAYLKQFEGFYMNNYM